MLRVLLLSLVWISLSAQIKQVFTYEASYLGIPLLDMNLTWVEDDSTVQISYDNQLKPFIAYFHPIHNIYQVRFLKGTFHPLTWSKSVSEGDLNFFLAGELLPDGREVRYSNEQVRAFPLGAFTVFSATHYLAAKAKDPEFFPVTLPVLIDGEEWEAVVNRYSRQQPHPTKKIAANQVLIQADLHYISGQRVMEENDILMSVIATEGTRFLLWVEPDGNYSKAQFGDFPKTVVLERTSN